MEERGAAYPGGHVDVSRWEVEVSRWEVEVSRWEVEVSRWEVDICVLNKLAGYLILTYYICVVNECSG